MLRMTLNDQYFDGVLKLVVDSVPSPVFLVDDDMRILECNTAASELLAADTNPVRHQCIGDPLHCLHAKDVAAGCGRGSLCKSCVMRNSVAEGIQGHHVVRRHHNMELIRNGQLLGMDTLITASPFPHHETQLVLLVIEPIGDVAGGKSRLPISGWSQLISQPLANSK